MESSKQDKVNLSASSPDSSRWRPLEGHNKAWANRNPSSEGQEVEISLREASDIKKTDSNMSRTKKERQDRSSSFSSIGDVSSNDDAESLADRISQIAVEQEEMMIERLDVGRRDLRSKNQEVESPSNKYSHSSSPDIPSECAQDLHPTPKIEVTDEHDNRVTFQRKMSLESPEDEDKSIDLKLVYPARSRKTGALPERGNLRWLDSSRGSESTDEFARNVTRSKPTNKISNEKNPADDDSELILNIRRSTWTLSEFDEAFNKMGICRQAQNQPTQTTCDSTGPSPVMQWPPSFSSSPGNSPPISPRWASTEKSTRSDSENLLIRASTNAALNNPNLISSGDQTQWQGHRELVGDTNRNRRPSFAHSIISLASSMDSLGIPGYGKKCRRSSKAASEIELPSRSSSNRPGGTGGAPGRGRYASVVRYFPVLEWLPNYKWENVWGDLTAGITVAVLNISTSLSAAIVAETSLGAAFKTSIVNTFFYAILCSSRHTSFGSYSIMSQMLLVSVQRALSDELILDKLNLGPTATWDPHEYERWHLAVIVMFTFLIGLIQMICGILNLGYIVSSFIPEALSSPLIAATAFVTAISQLANMCGTSNKILWSIEKNTTELWADLKDPPVDITDLFANSFRWIQQIILLIKYPDQINLLCVVISLSTLALLTLNQCFIQNSINRYFKRNIMMPIELILLIISIILSSCLDFSGKYQVPTCGPIEIEFGVPNLPELRLVRELWVQSFATALISFTTVHIMSKTYANKLNYEIDSNQELIACGAGNLFGGLFDAMPAAASFSRTAGQAEAGGKTQMASIVNCVVLLIMVHLLGQYVSVLPTSVMAAVLFFGFARMMARTKDVIKYWRVCKVDCAIWVVTYMSILATDLVTGFGYGFIFSIFTMLYRAQNRRCYLLGGIVGSPDVYVPLVKYPTAEEIDGIKIFQFCGPIHYVSADLYERLLRAKTRVNVKHIIKSIQDRGEELEKFNPRDYDLPTHIILDFSMINFIDSAAIQTLKKIVEDYQSINITVLVASPASHVANILRNESTLWLKYEKHFYVTLVDAVHCAMRERRRISVGSRPASRASLSQV